MYSRYPMRYLLLLSRFLDSVCPHYIYCKEELFDSLESRENIVYLPDRLSCAIKCTWTVSLKTNDGTVKKFCEIRCLLSFHRNLVSLSKFDSNDCMLRASNRILKVMHDSRIILQGENHRNYYILTRSLMQGGVPGIDRSPV